MKNDKSDNKNSSKNLLILSETGFLQRHCVRNEDNYQKIKNEYISILDKFGYDYTKEYTKDDKKSVEDKDEDEDKNKGQYPAKILDVQMHTYAELSSFFIALHEFITLIKEPHKLDFNSIPPDSHADMNVKNMNVFVKGTSNSLSHLLFCRNAKYDRKGTS